MSGIVKFVTGWGGDKIDVVEVLRETKASVFLKKNGMTRHSKSERREAKYSDYAQYHDTWTDAHTYLVAQAEGKVRAIRLQLEQASGKLGNVKGMKPPKVPA